jgi:hypothetical protein
MILDPQAYSIFKKKFKKYKSPNILTSSLYRINIVKQLIISNIEKIQKVEWKFV